MRLLRLHTAGFLGFVFLMGPMLAGATISIIQGLTLWSIGVLLNGYIFALNDLVDLPSDRYNAARQGSALVSGRVSERLALALSLALPLGSAILVALAGWERGPQVVFFAVLILAAFVNIYQKATRQPLKMDLLFSATMAAPIPVGCWATVGTVPPNVWIGTVVLFLLALELNSLAGNLKDLRSDSTVGFRTVATSRGARVDDDGYLVPGMPYRRYALFLHGGLTVIALSFALATGWASGIRAFIVVSLVSLPLTIWGAVAIGRILAGASRPSSTGRETYFACNFALLLVSTAVLAPLPFLVAALAALTTWEVAFRATSGRPRRGHAAVG